MPLDPSYSATWSAHPLGGAGLVVVGRHERSLTVGAGGFVDGITLWARAQGAPLARRPLRGDTRAGRGWRQGVATMREMVYVLIVVGAGAVLGLDDARNDTRTGRDFSPGSIQPRVMFKGVQSNGRPGATGRGLRRHRPPSPMTQRRTCWTPRSATRPVGQGPRGRRAGEWVTRRGTGRSAGDDVTPDVGPIAHVVHPMKLSFDGRARLLACDRRIHFVEVPPPESEEIHAVSSLVTYGWGCIPVQVRIWATSWGETSLFPKDGGSSRCRLGPSITRGRGSGSG